MMMEGNIGTIAISDEMLAVCVADSILKYPGVVSLADDWGTIPMDLLGRNVTAIKGVRIVRKDTKLKLNLYVNVAYGSKIPQLAWELQKKVQEDILEITGIKVEEIDIHIQGVSMEDAI